MSKAEVAWFESEGDPRVYKGTASGWVLNEQGEQSQMIRRNLRLEHFKSADVVLVYREEGEAIGMVPPGAIKAFRVVGDEYLVVGHGRAIFADRRIADVSEMTVVDVRRLAS